ncbi:Exocyst complex component EXO70B1 [Glycine max]|nr:Exocyst complex component EXO70B1 [Glycine max]
MDISSQNNDVGITEGKKEEVWQVVEYVDAFLLSSGEHVLDCVHVLPNLLERMVNKYNSGRNKFGEEPKDDKSFLNVVDHIFKLSTCNTYIVGEFYLEPCTKELAYETTTTKDMIIEAIVAMFCDLKNSIKNDNERIHVLNSAIHPLTRYVMNYLKYACEYKDTLEQVFEQGQGVNIEGIEIQNHKSVHEEVEDVGTPKNSPFTGQLMTIMDLGCKCRKEIKVV